MTHALDEALHLRIARMRVKRGEGGIDTVSGEELPSDPGVLGEHQVGLAEDAQRA